MTIDADTRKAILQVLWPPGEKKQLSVWAVLDLARDPRIYGLLVESRLEFLCLYSGRIPRELEMVAPHMVELLPGHRFVDRLLDEGWGKSWGIFVKIEDSSGLRHHLRKFLRVRDEEGRRLLLRYYDPRVLGVFLQTCDSAQFEEVFGPIATFVAEDETTASPVEYCLCHRELEVREVN